MTSLTSENNNKNYGKMNKIQKNIIKNLIKKEIRNLENNENYWGSEENVNNENTIYNYFLENKIVNSDT